MAKVVAMPLVLANTAVPAATAKRPEAPLAAVGATVSVPMLSSKKSLKT